MKKLIQVHVLAGRDGLSVGQAKKKMEEMVGEDIWLVYHCEDTFVATTRTGELPSEFECPECQCELDPDGCTLEKAKIVDEE